MLTFYFSTKKLQHQDFNFLHICLYKAQSALLLTYGVTNVIESDTCVLISRIWFIQSREESSMFFLEFEFLFF